MGKTVAIIAERARAKFRPNEPAGTKLGRGTPTLSPGEADFIEKISEGMELRDAATLHGLTMTEARDFLKRVDVREALTRTREAMLLGELAPSALRTAGAIMRDDTAPPATRARLALGVLAEARKLDEAAEASDNVAFDALTPAQLEDYAAALRERLTASAAITAEYAASEDVDDDVAALL